MSKLPTPQTFDELVAMLSTLRVNVGDDEGGSPYYRGEMDTTMATAALNCLDAMGLTVVPIKPSEEMKDAGGRAYLETQTIDDVYRAMVERTPYKK